MSRRNVVSATNTHDPSSDICPVCKSNRYLNPDLAFLINSQCYHTMCTTCVDRIFTSGPAPCPVAGCHMTLRKKGFHEAFFADLTVEREVDVRKRVAKVFNRRHDEFETLKDWNDYLEKVEGLVFEIVNGTEKERKAAEETLKAYKEMNQKEIEENLEAEREAGEDERQREKAELELARMRRAAAANEVKAEREVVKRTKRELLDRLAGTNEDPEEVTRRAEEIVKRTQEKIRGDAADAGSSRSGFPIRGLKQKVKPVAEKPYDAFGGLDLSPSRYVLQAEYPNEWLDSARSDTRHMTGGYSMQEYYARTMFEAFSGLGVFIADEAGHDNEGAPSIGAMAAVTAPVKLKASRDADDVF